MDTETNRNTKIDSPTPTHTLTRITPKFTLTHKKSVEACEKCGRKHTGVCVWNKKDDTHTERVCKKNAHTQENRRHSM